MIGDKKEFGSYILTSSTEYYSDELKDVSTDINELQGCCIPNMWTNLTLLAVKKYNHNASIFTFELPHKNRRLDLQPGAYLLVKVPGVEHGGGDAIRPYTSVSEDSRRGSFDILVKRYDEWGDDPKKQKAGGVNFYFNTGTNNNYKPPGAVSNWIHNLKIGNSLLFKYSKICFSKVSLDLLGITMSDLWKENNIRRMSEDKKMKQRLLTESDSAAPATITKAVEPGAGSFIQDSVFAHMMRLGTNPTALFNNVDAVNMSTITPEENQDNEDGCGVGSTSSVAMEVERDDSIDDNEDEEDGILSNTSDKAARSDASSNLSIHYEETKEEIPHSPLGAMRVLVQESDSSQPGGERDEGGMVPSPPSRPRPSNFRRPSVGGTSGSLSRSRSNSTSSSRGNTPPKPGEGQPVPLASSAGAKPKEAAQEYSRPSRSSRGGGSGGSGGSGGGGNVHAAVPTARSFNLETPDGMCKKLTLLAVGVGVSPMIRILRAALDLSSKLETVTFCYGVREVKDILMREVLEQLANTHTTRFKLVYCVGSRYSNMHFAAKKRDEYVPPPEPEGFGSLDEFEKNVCKKLGWIDEITVKTHAPGPAEDHRVVVCGLPGVYDKLCGSRFHADLPVDSVLARLGFEGRHVIKL